MQGRIEQRHIGEIGENGGLQCPVIRHDTARSDPNMLDRLKLLAREIMGQRDRLDFDRSLPLPVFAHIGRRHMEILLLDVAIADKLLRHR